MLGSVENRLFKNKTTITILSGNFTSLVMVSVGRQKLYVNFGDLLKVIIIPI
jgi:hypothetical protein